MKKILEFKRLIIIITHSLQPPPPPKHNWLPVSSSIEIKISTLEVYTSKFQSSKNRHELFDLIAPYVPSSSLKPSTKILDPHRVFSFAVLADWGTLFPFTFVSQIHYLLFEVYSILFYISKVSSAIVINNIIYSLHNASLSGFRPTHFNTMVSHLFHAYISYRFITAKCLNCMQ